MANEHDESIRTCLYSWGSGSSGQTGLATWEDVHTPVVVDFSFTEDKVALKMIAAGGSHSFATSGKIKHPSDTTRLTYFLQRTAPYIAGDGAQMVS